jgi:transforming growth factor-beta-induced protein
MTPGLQSILFSDHRRAAAPTRRLATAAQETTMHQWISKAFAALATAGLLAACGGGGSDSTTQAEASTLAEALKSSGQTSTMAGAMANAGLTEQMSRSDSSYTLLMPSDEAMSEYAEELAELTKPENRAALADYVKAHMVEGKLLAEALAASGAAADGLSKPATATAAGGGPITVNLKNLLGGSIEVVIDGNQITINGAAIQRSNIVVGNGVLHILSGPLFRPSLFGIVATLPQTSTLEAAIRAAGLTDALRAGGAKTLFAPSDRAFEGLLRELNLTASQLLANKPLLTQVLTYHVLASEVLARQVKDGATPVTLQGQAIRLDVERGRFGQRDIRITDARNRVSNVTLPNLRAYNGVVHLIDKVLLPTDKDIVAIAAANADFSILVAALQAAGLVDTLKSPGPFTVLAPTNAAFAALLHELNLSADQLLANKPLLTQVLTYHVLPGRAFANDVSKGLVAASVQGQPVKFASSNGGVAITDARGRTSKVVATDIQATNGVIHVIDRVILPTDRNIVQVAQSLPQFSLLVEAVVAADLAGVLSGPGPFTVFAPTNDAFVALLGELGTTKDALFANKPLLAKVLTYHVLPAQVLSSGIPFGTAVPTVQGQTITIGRDLKITDQNGRQAGIVATDVAATNGVVHVIDKVILPR